MSVQFFLTVTYLTQNLKYYFCPFILKNSGRVSANICTLYLKQICMTEVYYEHPSS